MVCTPRWLGRFKLKPGGRNYTEVSLTGDSDPSAWAAFRGSSTGSWIRNGIARTQSSSHSSGLDGCAVTLAQDVNQSWGAKLNKLSGKEEARREGARGQVQ